MLGLGRSIAKIIGLALLYSLAINANRLAAQSEENLHWSSAFTVESNGVDGRLNVTVEIDRGFHIYPSKDAGSALPTKITLEKSFKAATLAGDFEPDADPVDVFDPITNELSKHHEGMVTWSVPLKFTSGTNPQALEIPVQISGQICLAERCNQFKSKTVARLLVAAKPGDVFRPEFAHAVFKGTLSPKTARPGQTVTLRIQAEPDAGWTIPALADLDDSVAAEGAAKPTIFVLNKTNGWRVSGPELDIAAPGKSGAAWTVSVDVPSNAEAKTYSLGGLIGLQAQSPTEAESNPATLGFQVDLPVAAESMDGTIALTFNAGPTYELIQEARIKRSAAQNARAGEFANYSILTVVGLALLAGFILNFMPCVLPVIGLKIMSFVQQAGENPRRILMLNVAFATGVLAVFMLLAFVASRAGWGGLFQSDRFQIVMIGVVFAFALSFMGVWEIPIPGMSGSGGVGKLAAKEGFIGAFLKGILTTLLATPCSGPLLVPTVIWALAQPAWLTYLTFSAMGVGMALPYLVIGAFPKLIGLLPRPGNWMVTFKHAMGFAMLGAAIFLFGSLKEKFGIPTLSMALAIGIACSVIGHTSIAAELSDKLKAWAYGLAIVVLGCWIAFFVLIPTHELEWNTFSKVALREELDKGNIVFVDFTADW